MNLLALFLKGLLLATLHLMLTLGLILLMPLLVVPFLEGFLPTRLLPWRERAQQERLSLLFLSFVISCEIILLVESFILSPSLQSLVK